jgi:serine/threonine protein kinase
VLAAEHIATGDRVAIKRLSQLFVRQKSLKPTRCLRELELLDLLRNHAHIITLRDIVIPHERHNFDDVFIVYSYMESDLHQTIYSSNKLTVEHVKYFTYQILSGLHYMHSKGVMHRVWPALAFS